MTCTCVKKGDVYWRSMGTSAHDCITYGNVLRLRRRMKESRQIKEFQRWVDLAPENDSKVGRRPLSRCGREGRKDGRCTTSHFVPDFRVALLYDWA